MMFSEVLSVSCHHAGVKTKKRKPQQLLEVSSVGWKTVLLWKKEEDLQSVVSNSKVSNLISKRQQIRRRKFSSINDIYTKNPFPLNYI